MLNYLKRVLELARPYRFRLVLGLLCGFFSGALVSTSGLSLKLAVDAVFPQEAAQPGAANVAMPGKVSQTDAGPAATGNSTKAKRPGFGGIQLPAPAKRFLDELGNWFRPPDHPSTARLILVISFIPASMFLRSLLAYLNTYLLSWVGIRAANDLRVRLFEHLLNLPLKFFGHTSTGDLMARIENAMAVNSTIKASFGVIIREPVSVFTVVVALVCLKPLLSLFTLLIFPVCLVPVIVFGRKFRKSDSGIHGKFANLSKVMHEAFTGMRVIKGYNLESLVVQDFRRATNGLTGSAAE